MASWRGGAAEGGWFINEIEMMPDLLLDMVADADDVVVRAARRKKVVRTSPAPRGRSTP